MEKFVTLVGVTVVTLFIVICVSFLLSWPVYMLWNGCLVGAVNGVHEVTWLQAWGLSILSSFLFKTHNLSKKD